MRKARDTTVYDAQGRLRTENVQAKCQGSETGLYVQDNGDSHLLSPGRSVSLGGGACAFPKGHFYLVVG